ncbi:hypothetical protein AAG570_008437 [Ranatra chinensis]|uniref:Uncharacterized protein n=1 Tax=Ranatra chinensis TaxID=642074 RepID=A0ABD0Z7Z8_9HEMI
MNTLVPSTLYIHRFGHAASHKHSRSGRRLFTEMDREVTAGFYEEEIMQLISRYAKRIDVAGDCVEYIYSNTISRIGGLVLSVLATLRIAGGEMWQAPGPYWAGQDQRAAAPYFSYLHQHVYQAPPHHPNNYHHWPYPNQEPLQTSSKWHQHPEDPILQAQLKQAAEGHPQAEVEQSTQAPTEQTQPKGSIVDYSSGIAPDGSYSYKYETADGISRQETGIMKSVEGVAGGVREVRGSYSYPSPDGRVVTVHYIADESGYRTRTQHTPRDQHERDPHL